MEKLFDDNEAYQDDIPLLTELKLEHFKGLKNSEEKYLGMVKRGKSGWVKVFVTCLPAQFFRFQGVSIENHSFKLETGSGSLRDYWPSAELFLEGMLVSKS